MFKGPVAKNESRSPSNLKNENGAALVEAALITIPFLLLFFGVIEFSLLLYNQQVINNAVREGARAGIVARIPRLPDTDIKAEVIKYAQNYLVTFGTDQLDTDDIVITKITGPKNILTDASGNPVKDKDGKTVPGTWGKFEDILIVSTNYTYKFLFLANIGMPEITLTTMNSASRMELE